jgi:hypothetical protein
MPRTKRDLRVMKKRRLRSLLHKVSELSAISGQDMALLIRGHDMKKPELFKTTTDPSWPGPGLGDLVRILVTNRSL